MRPRSIGLLACALLACSGARPVPASPPRDGSFWDRPRAGANSFAAHPSARRFRDARAIGIELVRLAPDPWQGLERDFLIGDADRYEGLVEGDLVRLRGVLDAAHAAGARVVLTMLSLPGARWRQHHHDEDDARLFADARFEERAATFWGDLARALRGHPAIVGYDLLNEPRTDDLAALRRVYVRMVAAIRAEDPDVPIVLSVGRDAEPRRFEGFEPLDDPHVLYAFHLYEPWEHVTWRTNRGEVAYGSDAWSRRDLAAAIAFVERWQVAHGVPSTRIFASEIGCDRRIPGADRYFDDALALVEAHGWHWAFHAFRDDGWDGHDHELGARPLSEAEREEYARGRALEVERSGGPAFQVIRRHLARGSIAPP